MRQEYGELRVSSYYNPDRDWEVRSVGCSFAASDRERTSLSGLAPEALTRLAQDGWRLVTSVSVQKMEEGRQLVQEIIHTLVRLILRHSGIPMNN